MAKKYKTFTINEMTASLGAEVAGLDISKKLSKPALRELNQAWLEHQVLFFRDQPLTPEQHVTFTKNFGGTSRSGLYANFGWLSKCICSRIPRSL